MQMTPSFMYSLTQAVLLVKMGQLDQWTPVSRTLSSGWPRQSYAYDNKTEFIVIASRHLLKKAAVNTDRVGDCDVSKVSVVGNLGAWFDDQLTMAVHITKMCSGAFHLLHNIRDVSGNTFQWMQLRLLSTLLLVAE